MPQSRQWLEVTLQSVGDAVMATDTEARIVFLNPVAERLTGWTEAEARGRPLGEVFVILDEKTREPAVNPALRALAEGRIQGLANHTVLVARDGTERGIDDSAAPIRDETGALYGVVLVFRDVTAQRRAEQRRGARLAVTQILSSGLGIEDSCRRIAESLPRELGWDAASVWLVDPRDQTLHRRAGWAAPGSGLEPLLDAEPFADDMLAATPEGAVVASRARAAPAPGTLTSPIVVDGARAGVIALYSRTPRKPDDDLAETVAVLAAQLGHLVQRRRAQAAVRRREAELDDFFEDAAVGLRLVGPDGVILRANRTELDFLGYSAEEYVGRHVADFHVDRDLAFGLLARLRDGAEVRDCEARMRARDGSIRHVLLDSNGWWEEGRLTRSRWFTRDITARKHAETSLAFLHQASKSLAGLVDYRTTLQRVAGLAVPDFADWCVIQMAGPDHAREQVAWVHRDPARAEQVLEAFLRHPTPPDAEYGIPLALRTGKPELIRTITDDMLQTAARTPEHLRLLRELGLSSSIIVPIKGKAGVIGALRFTAAESGRRYTRADLDVALDLAAMAAIAIENALLYEQAREADRRKDEFLATLAHELRNPLAPIRSGLDLLGLDPAPPADTLELMRRQFDHLVRLADDLLDISRITHGKVELRREAVDLGALVDAALAATGAAADGKEHDVEVTRAAQEIWVDADPVRLLQVLENLLSNAFKYTDPSGRIEVRLESDGGRAVVRVRDDGIGIEPDLLARIFEPFTQASSGIDRSEGGLGIGLTLVRHFVELHGGTVSAVSEGAGKGSEFTVRLPTIDAPRPIAAPRATPAPEAVEQRTVLVVDDNSSAAGMLSLLLGRLGATRVEVAADGPAALDKAEEIVPDLVLLDIGLPGMDGYQVARELRRRPRLQSAVLVALTGYGQAEDRQRSRDAGFDEHLVKPASIDDLQRVLSLRGR
jgi:PAS domain S-box-containing protein